MKNYRRLLAVALLSLAAGPALATEPVFAPGVRVGLVPIEGLALAKDFPGFASPDQSVKVVVTELPAAAYGAIDDAFKGGPKGANALKAEVLETAAGKGYFTAEAGRDGDTSVKQYSLIIPGGTFSGYVAVQVPDTAAPSFSSEAVRRMLVSTVLRNDVPVDEQLALLPFRVTDLGAFKTVRTLVTGAAILLADDPDESNLENAPYIIVAVMPGSPKQPEDRGRFAQQVAATIPGLREARITSSEPMRIDGTPGFETRVDALFGKADTPVTVVQWLRFGQSNATLRIVAAAKREDWTSAFPRFRAVRDGIEPRQ